MDWTASHLYQELHLVQTGYSITPTISSSRLPSNWRVPLLLLLLLPEDRVRKILLCFLELMLLRVLLLYFPPTFTQNWAIFSKGLERSAISIQKTQLFHLFISSRDSRGQPEQVLGVHNGLDKNEFSIKKNIFRKFECCFYRSAQ